MVGRYSFGFRLGGGTKSAAGETKSIPRLVIHGYLVLRQARRSRAHGCRAGEGDGEQLPLTNDYALRLMPNFQRAIYAGSSPADNLQLGNRQRAGLNYFCHVAFGHEG